VTVLTILEEGDRDAIVLDTRDVGAITQALQAVGVTLERWTPAEPLPADADNDVLLAAYDADIKRLAEIGGYKSFDVIRMLPDNPKREEMRAKFLDEHIHEDDEVRFFVEGAGMFYLHAGGRVHMLLCEAGDLIKVPAGLRHWFDMGPAPRFCAIRMFTTPEGWVAKFTGDTIAGDFPRYEPPLA
jgi:1,2-dihydroxy-3-keto-5-methylthiopentene dioxygenase